MDRIKARQMLDWVVLKLRIPWIGTSILIILGSLSTIFPFTLFYGVQFMIGSAAKTHCSSFAWGHLWICHPYSYPSPEYRLCRLCAAQFNCHACPLHGINLDARLADPLEEWRLNQG